MCRFKFFNKNDFFIEYKWAFGNDFLKELFQEQYQCKYSLIGDGIYYLIIIDNKIYDIDIKECKKLVENDNKKAFRDSTKDIIVEKICNKLKDNNIEYTTNKGKIITFKNNDFLFRVEIVKKAAMPE